MREADKDGIVAVARELITMGFDLVATRGTANAIETAGMPVETVNKVLEGRPHVVDMLKNDEISFIVNTTEGTQAIADSFTIRRTALQRKVCYTTTIAGAHAICLAIQNEGKTKVHRLQDLHGVIAQ